jgi:hypothetical protein
MAADALYRIESNIGWVPPNLTPVGNAHPTGFAPPADFAAMIDLILGLERSG